MAPPENDLNGTDGIANHGGEDQWSKVETLSKSLTLMLIVGL